MALFLKEHKKFLLLLAKHKVKFLLIGGYAVIYHGYERTTSDMDVWLKPTNKNRGRFISALREHGVADDQLQIVNTMNFTKPQVVNIGRKPNQIEFLTKVTGLEFEEASAKKVTLDLEQYQIGLLGYDDLITNKMLTGRLQDQADVETLRKIQRERNKNE
ncbi:MAG TPA: hypothetical protein VE868_06520 [Balneolaceae bacterium]|nr:hypothetical protein [Balneolaceae bacterium]